MGLSRVFVLLAITLFLVACWCAFATLSETEAKKAVTDLQTLTAQTLQKAQQKYKNAERVRQDVDSRKVKAQSAASEAETAAKGNEDAKAFADTANSEMQQCVNLHPSAKATAEAVVPVMEQLKTKALKLEKDAKINVEPKDDSADPYAHVTESVKIVKAQRNTLDNDIDAAQPKLSAANAALDTMSSHASKAEIAKDQVKAVVAVAKMESSLTDAAADIAIIQQKKEKVDAVVKEIDEIVKKAPSELIPQIVGISNNAEGEANKITRIFKQVQADKTAILGHKKTADGFLETIKTATDESQVRTQLADITNYAGQTVGLLQKINQAVQSADTHLTNANYRKKDIQDLLSPKSSKLKSKDAAAPNDKKPGQPAKEGAKPTSEGTNQQKDTNTRQTMQEVTTKQMTKDTKGQSVAKPGQHAEGATTTTTSEGTKEHKDTTPGPYVEKSAKNPGTKRKVSPYDTNNDGAITATFSVLLVLIVCAALNG